MTASIPHPARTAAAAVPSRWLLLTCSSACALIVLDTNIVAVSLPSVARTLGAGFTDIEWVVSAYMLAFATLLLPAGGLADRYGRRRALLAGLAIFAGASLLCGAAWTVEVLQWARALKGVGAALLLTAALAVIGHSYTTESDRIHAWAVWGTCLGVSMTLAPLLGGAITQWLGWRWIFLLNLPVCACLAWLVRRHVPESCDHAAARIDLWGGVSFSAGLCCVIWAMIGANAAGWHSHTTLLRGAAGLLLLAVFVVVELLQKHPMVDLRLFRSPQLMGAVLAMFGYATSAQVMMTFLPLYLQNAFSFSAIAAGSAMLPFALAMMVWPRIGIVLARRRSLPALLAMGLAMVCAGNLLVAVAAWYGQFGWVLAGMVATGSGAGLLNGNTQKAVMSQMPAGRSGMGSGIGTTTRFAGIVLAVACLGGVLVARTADYVVLEAGRSGTAVPAAAVAAMVERVAAGDLPAALREVDPAAREAAGSILKTGFIRAFSMLMLIAAVIAAVSGLLVMLIMLPRR